MREATLGGKPYSVGLNWQLAATRAEAEVRREEGGHACGVLLKAGGRVAGVGFADGGERKPPPSAAALLAVLHPGQAVCAVEWADTDAGRQYWMAAVSGGAVVSGTDALFDEPGHLRRQVQDLVSDFGCRVAGSASVEFGGDGTSALAPASRSAHAAAAIKPLQAGANPAQLLFLLALFGVIGYLGWTLLAPEPQAPAALPALPVVDKDAELRKQAVAERNRLLSQDLSGFGPLRLARAARLAAKPLERSAADWTLTLKHCDAAAGGGSCAYTWHAMGAGSTPAGLAQALGLPRDAVSSDLRADTVSTSAALGAQGEAVAANESTALAGRAAPLIDRCRRYNGKGGTCTLDAAQTVAVANAQLLPPGLQYRRGRLSLAGPLGRADDLLPLFDGPELAPWVRADRFDINYESLEFRLEGHYVIP
jgi:hypothetical protein